MRTFTLPVTAWFLLLGVLVFSPAMSQAQFPDETPNGRLLQPQQLSFGPKDFVNVKLGHVKPRIFLGEPLLIPIRLVNHTRFPVTVETNFNPRSQLTVEIKAPDSRRRPYYGPYPMALYSPSNIKLEPLQEIETKFMVWADLEQPDSLALNQLTHYSIRLSLRLRVLESGMEGSVPLNPVEVDVVPTPEKLKPLVEALSKEKGFAAAQRNRLTEDIVKRRAQLIDGCPPSPLLPYVAFGAASELLLLWGQDQQNEKLRDEALRYMKSAAYSDSASKRDFQLSLLKQYDERNMSQAAAELAAEIVRELKPWERGRMGDDKLIRKYLINSRELSVEKSWSLLE